MITSSPVVTSRIWPNLKPALPAAAMLLVVTSWLLPPLWVLVCGLVCVALVATLRYPVVGFCLLALAVPWTGGIAISTGSFSFTPTDLVVALVAAVWLVRCVSERISPLRGAVLWPYIALFLLAISLSALGATDRNASVREIVKWLELGAMYASGVSLITTRREVVWIVGALVLGGVSQAFLGFAQVALHVGPTAFVIGGGELLRAYGSFDQPNPYAGYLNMTLPFALAVAVVVRSPRHRLWSSLAAATIAAAILASASRGAVLSGAAAAVTLGFLAISRLRPWVRLALLAALVAAWLATLGLVPSGPVDRALNAVGLGNVSFQGVTHATYSSVERAAHWVAGVRMFADRPITGVGIGNYADAYPAFHPRGWYPPLEHAHNYLINIAAEAGIVGLVAYVLLAGSALWYSYAPWRTGRISARKIESDYAGAAALGVVGALVATDVHNMFDVLYVHGMVALLGMLLALAVAADSVSLRNERDREEARHEGDLSVGHRLVN